MKVVATVPPVAKFDGGRVLIAVQEEAEVSLSVHEALRLLHELKREAQLIFESARSVKPEPCEVIAFPAAKVRRAIVAARKLGAPAS